MRNPTPIDTAVATALIRFRGELLHVRRDAGEPSLRKIARDSNWKVSASTISRYLTGSTLPSWDFTTAFLRGCGIPTVEIDTDWKRRWSRLADLVDPINVTADMVNTTDAVQAEEQNDDADDAVDCPECGADVRRQNLAKHQRWHAAQSGTPGVRALRLITSDTMPANTSRTS
jgi:transcriptional regulator with XRE-family HTH domain